MRRVVWLLDFDGVINVSKPRWSEKPHQRTLTFLLNSRVEQWKIRWSPTLVARIRMLAALEHVEVCWASTWCTSGDNGQPQTRLLEEALGLPKLRDAFTAISSPTQGAAGAAKLRAARGVLAAGDDLIWTDDEWTPGPGHPLREELTCDGRSLLIQPNQTRGLTREDLEEIESWLRRV